MIQSDEPAPDPAASARLSVELAAATGIDADVVILPLRRTDDGVGVYDTQTIPLVKELREA